MPELGNRANVMGPQPIAERSPLPAEMTAAAEHVLKLIAAGDRAGLEAMAIERARAGAGALAQAARPGVYDGHEIIAQARANRHYFIKARIVGPGAAPIVVQVRLGEHEGRWVIWDAKNLTGRRSAWTK